MSTPTPPPSVATQTPTALFRKETPAERVARLSHISDVLAEQYPGAECELNHRNPFELLIATILAAQCTDALVNSVTPGLFEKFPDATALANAEPTVVEELVRKTGFYKNKAKNIRETAKMLVERHGGQVPNVMADLVKLPGAGRKTANMVLGIGFGQNDGIAVDTHVKRLAQRLAFTLSDEPDEIEAELMKLIPREWWTKTYLRMVLHGRRVCVSKGPKCGECALVAWCPSREEAT